jgi:uracil-DNA glycosylase
MLLKDVQIDMYTPKLVILYGYEAWFVTLTDKHRLTGLATWVMGRVFVTNGE